MKIKILSNKDNQCPYCNSKKIYYFDEVQEDSFMLYYKCECRECKRYFEQWFELRFVGCNVGSDGCTEAVVGEEIEYEEE